jgi:hypothetical protein
MPRTKERMQTFVWKSALLIHNSERHFRRQYIQFIIVPIAFTLASFVGIAVTSAGITLYGQVLWDPLKLIDRWDNRAAAFFTSFAFALGTLGTNVSANSLSAGNDMTALCPRYINIRRGQVICAILGGWALCPWEILARCVTGTLGSHPRQVLTLLLSSATGFLSFMSGYTVFLGPITGIMITDVSPGAPFIHPYHWQRVSSLITSRLVLACTPHICRRSINVSTSREVQVYIWCSKPFQEAIVRAVLYSLRRTGAPPWQ